MNHVEHMRRFDCQYAVTELRAHAVDDAATSLSQTCHRLHHRAEVGHGFEGRHGLTEMFCDSGYQIASNFEHRLRHHGSTGQDAVSCNHAASAVLGEAWDL